MGLRAGRGREEKGGRGVGGVVSGELDGNYGDILSSADSMCSSLCPRTG